jgi:hypothetical protein
MMHKYECSINVKSTHNVPTQYHFQLSIPLTTVKLPLEGIVGLRLERNLILSNPLRSRRNRTSSKVNYNRNL